jgi:RNA 2',3'-cyclic 3'-phosphodiesterase
MRLFVAITPPEEVRARVLAVIEQLKPLSRVPRWVRPEGLHLTLKFLGETKEDQLSAIISALNEIHSAAVHFEFHGVGSFPKHQHPRVIWAGVRESSELATLASAIESRLVPLGFPPEARAFSPHITLARINSREHLENLVSAAAAFASYDFGTMHAREFHLFKSTLKPSGAEYASLATFRFTPDAHGSQGHQQ